MAVEGWGKPLMHAWKVFENGVLQNKRNEGEKLCRNSAQRGMRGLPQPCVGDSCVALVALGFALGDLLRLWSWLQGHALALPW
jgi:hypothetical protein